MTLATFKSSLDKRLCKNIKFVLLLILRVHSRYLNMDTRVSNYRILASRVIGSYCCHSSQEPLRHDHLFRGKEIPKKRRP